MTVTPAIREDKRLYPRTKLQVTGEKNAEEVIHNMACLNIGNIGYERYNNRAYIWKLCEIFRFGNEISNYFKKMVKAKQEKVYAIVGQRNSNVLLHRITAEQCGVKYSLDPTRNIFVHQPPK